MLVDPHRKLGWYPNHKDWIHERVNSQNKKFFLRDLKSVLTRCGVLDRFRKGPFCEYLDLADEIWFGLGKDQASFGREDFCLCSGLNMSTLLEGFREKKEVGRESILSRYFEDKRSTVELLEATFKELKVTDGDNALKMAYLLMVTQFFRTDEGRTSVPAWLWPLAEDEKAFTSFSWGTYIFDVTLLA
ncbi:hypothetical protein Dsin_001393 [Dipteronia sinensis]|uniref:DUF1985 domain-containing protein n=1 Tax=Dipteronia sinensis TaxID=43782 RepID=A0AAE0B526_9ROSI|nr:hypothetical protein Dsin_001393 [Dipteronia sinensis]